MAAEETGIAKRLHNEEIHAFKLLFDKHYKPMVLKAWTMLEDKMEAEDIVQKLFVDLWENKFWKNVHKSSEAYVYVALRNRCLKVIRKRKFSPVEDVHSSMRQNYYTIDSDDNNEDLYHHIKHVMDDLPKQRLQTLNLVYLENKKYQEAADEMGISINSVKTHLRLALKYLRSRISVTE